MKKQIIAWITVFMMAVMPALASEIELSADRGEYGVSSGFVSVGMYYASGMEAQVINDVNAQRIRYGLSPLIEDQRLMAAARIRAQEIVRKFSHTRPDGTKWSTVSPAAKGENIARGHNSAYRVMAAWMSSEGHRANILRESFGSIGVCALQVNGVIYWVQLFGR